MQYALLMGSPVDGYVVYGPFPTPNDALAYAKVEECKNDSYWVVNLHTPSLDALPDEEG
jgi:hypothetical protein